MHHRKRKAKFESTLTLAKTVEALLSAKSVTLSSKCRSLYTPHPYLHRGLHSMKREWKNSNQNIPKSEKSYDVRRYA